MTQLFRRVVNVSIGPKSSGASAALTAIERSSGVDVSNLDCVFKVKKNLKAEANTCELQLFNLAPSSRALLETPKKLVLRLEAGYPNKVAQLYLGEVRHTSTSRAGPDIVTHIETGDSEKEIQSAHINLSVGPKVPAEVALTAIARELKVGIGNVPIMAAKLRAKGVVPFGKGTLIFGSAARALDDFCRSADLEWSIQDGVLQILDRGKALEGMATLLSSDTGLIGSPTIDLKGIVTFRAFIQPDLRPGHKVAFNSLAFKVSQGYRIQECEYTGDTSADPSSPWYVEGKCKKY